MAKDLSQSRRGISFEKKIEVTNKFYKSNRMAIIEKQATPTRNVNRKIVYGQKSTVDFMGMIMFDTFGPRPIAFEAKETTGSDGRDETSFPLIRSGKDVKELIQAHQRIFLNEWVKMGGIGFVLIHFKNRGEVYRTPIELIDRYYAEMYRGGRKSIPITEFQAGWIVDIEDYLKLL